MDLLGCIFHLGFFLVHLLEFFLVCPPNWHPRRYWCRYWFSPISLLGISMIPCVNFLVWILGLVVMYSVVHKFHPLRHEFVHLWRKCLVCWIVWRKNLLCLIFIPLLFWRCMLSGICSVPLLVLCTSRILLVVLMIIYHLAYHELILLYLVGLTVCDCNIII